MVEGTQRQVSRSESGLRVIRDRARQRAEEIKLSPKHRAIMMLTEAPGASILRGFVTSSQVSPDRTSDEPSKADAKKSPRRSATYERVAVVPLVRLQSFLHGLELRVPAHGCLRGDRYWRAKIFLIFTDWGFPRDSRHV